MAQTVTAEFDDKELRDFFRNLKSRLERVKGAESKFMGLLSALVYQDVMSHFKSEMGSEGPWAQWSAAYKKYRQTHGPGSGNILQWSGKLRQNFKPSDWKKQGDSFVWFNDAKTKSGFAYAWLHDTGGPNHPQRDFMWLSDAAVAKISEQTMAFLIEDKV